MATVFGKRLTFEFAEKDSVLGRATLTPDGQIELEFSDPEVAARFKGHLCDPQLYADLVFDGSDIRRVPPQSNPLLFIEACQSFNYIYRVRRVP